MGALDVSPQILVNKVAEKLHGNENIKPPAWSAYAKTGPHVERLPGPDFWYVRCASILRKAYSDKLGVGRLRTYYGGRTSRGTHPGHHMPAGGNIIRKAMQQLEKAGYLKKEKVGRMITAQGKFLLDSTAKEIVIAGPVVKIEKAEGEKIGRAAAGRAEEAEIPARAKKAAAGGAPKKAPVHRGKGKAGKP